MCWVAVDRGIKIAKTKKLRFSLEKWEKTRGQIKKAILEKGFHTGLNSFVQSFSSKTLDASCLLVPLMGFLPARDPRVQGTIDAIMARLMSKGTFVRRYESEDGLPGTEGAFILCTFWLVKALLLSGRMQEAKKIFSNMLMFSSPLGLFAEEIDTETGRQLGNFPQAFSHIGLINCALYFSVVKGKKHRGPTPMGLSRQKGGKDET